MRYWKEKDGRFYARVAVPKLLQPYLDRPRGELIEALGADRRVALRIHPAAVARLQGEIAASEQKVNFGITRLSEHKPSHASITTGPVTVSFRSFESNTRHQGDRIWLRCMSGPAPPPARPGTGLPIPTEPHRVGRRLIDLSYAAMASFSRAA